MAGEHSRDKSLSHTLTKQLECPVCLNVCSTQIYMCPNGHNVCSSCQPQLTECPMCRHAGKPSFRNLFAERLSQSAIVPCKNSEQGCTESLSADDMEIHSMVCEFSQTCMFESCPWKGSVANLADHARNIHSENYFKLSEMGVIFDVSTDIHPNAGLRKSRPSKASNSAPGDAASKTDQLPLYSTSMLEFENHIFWYHTKIFEDDKNISFKVQLCMIGSIPKTSNQSSFSYELVFCARRGASKYMFKNNVALLKSRESISTDTVITGREFVKIFTGSRIYRLKLFAGLMNLDEDDFHGAERVGGGQWRLSRPDNFDSIRNKSCAVS